MNAKRWLGIAAGVLLLGAVGFVAMELYEESARNRRAREAFTRDEFQSQSFAQCVSKELNSEGLRQLVIFQYKPDGLMWQAQIKFSTQYNLPPPAVPTGDALHKFERQGDGLDWPAFLDLRKRCPPSGGPPFEARWRGLFWRALAEQPVFQLAVSEVEAANDAVLSAYREQDAANRRRSESDAADQQRKRESELFNQPR